MQIKSEVHISCGYYGFLSLSLSLFHFILTYILQKFVVAMGFSTPTQSIQKMSNSDYIAVAGLQKLWYTKLHVIYSKKIISENKKSTSNSWLLVCAHME